METQLKPEFYLVCDHTVEPAVALSIERAAVARGIFEHPTYLAVVVTGSPPSNPSGIAVTRKLDAAYLDRARRGAAMVLGPDARSAELLLDLASLVAAPALGVRFARGLAVTRRWETAPYASGFSFLVAAAALLASAGWAASSISVLAEAGAWQEAQGHQPSVLRVVVRPGVDVPTSQWLVNMSFGALASDLGLFELGLQLRDQACVDSARDTRRLLAAKAWSRAVTAARRGQPARGLDEFGGLRADLPHVFAELSPPELVRAYCDKAELALQVGDTSAAAAMLKRCVRDSRADEPAALAYDRAHLRLLLANRRHREVVALAREIRTRLGRGPTRESRELVGMAWHSEGLVHYRDGHFRRALTCLKRALALAQKDDDSPGSVAAQIVIAKCQFGLGKAAEARTTLQRALRVARKRAPQYLQDIGAASSEFDARRRARVPSERSSSA